MLWWILYRTESCKELKYKFYMFMLDSDFVRKINLIYIKGYNSVGVSRGGLF